MSPGCSCFLAGGGVFLAHGVEMLPNTCRIKSGFRFDSHDPVSEGLGVERGQILDRLADADEVHRQAELAGQSHQNAALGGAVELGDHESGDAGDLAEGLDLRERVLADGGVQHQQRRVRRACVLLLQDANDLLELGHQLLLVLQPPGGIDQQNVGAFGFRAFQRLEGDAGRIGALCARDHLGAGAFAPQLELLDRGRAERVGGGQHHELAFVIEPRGELADGRRLARAVHAGDQHHEGLLGRIDGEGLLDRPQHILDLAGDEPADFLVAERAVAAVLLHGSRDLARRIDAEIGLDQKILELLQGRGIERLLGKIGEPVAELGRGAGEAAGEPPEQSGARRVGVHAASSRRPSWPAMVTSRSEPGAAGRGKEDAGEVLGLGFRLFHQHPAAAADLARQMPLQHDLADLAQAPRALLGDLRAPLAACARPGCPGAARTGRRADE